MFSTKPIHSFHLSSQAKKIVEINSIEDLTYLKENTDAPGYIVIGEGSNTVFVDNYLGTIILNKYKGIEHTQSENFHHVSVNSGNNWNEFVIWCLNNHIYGLENLGLIPGTVGACPIQNIGAYGVEVKTFIDSVEYFDVGSSEIKSLDNASCQFCYRDSVFKHDLKTNTFITKVNFIFPKAWQPQIGYAPLNRLINPSPQEIFEKVCEVRSLKLPDPKVIGNAGSFFKNPIISNEKVTELLSQYNDLPSYDYDLVNKKIAAGWLIDKAGLKGFSIGNVAVHDKQALVLTNITGEASGEELIELASYVMKQVHDKFGVRLEPEVRFISKHGEIDFCELDQNVYG